MGTTTRTMSRGGYVARSQERQGFDWWTVGLVVAAVMALAACWWVYGFTSSIDGMALSGVVGR